MRLIEFLEQGGATQNIDSQWNKMNVNERANYIKNDLLRRGYTQNQTAAILGNLLQENSSLGTHTQNSRSGAVGIAQWLGSRKKSIVAQGKHSSISGQLDFLDQEIKGKGAWTNNVGGKNAFFGSDNVEQLTRIFRKDFERPGEHEANDARRIKNAYSILGQSYTPSMDDSQTFDNPPQMQAFYQTLPEDMKKNISWDNFQTIAKSNPSVLGVFNVDTQKQFEENIRLENERQQQEQKKSEVEYENQQIQLALQAKQQEREQILSMIPQSQSITTGQIKPQFKEGGKIRSMVYQAGGKVLDTKKYPISEIRAFYGDMLSSQWYRDRIKRNGYERQWTDYETGTKRYNPKTMTKDDVAADIVSNRMMPLVYAKFDGESLKQATGYNPLFETINMNPNELKRYNVSMGTVLAHEVSHATRNGDYAGAPLSVFEYNFIRQRADPDADINPKVDKHILNPEEAKSDMDAIRYNLYKKGKFDPKTGKYKTKSGLFEDSLLDSMKDDNSVKRMRQVYKGKGLTEMMNTIAINDSEDNESILYARLGGVI